MELNHLDKNGTATMVNVGDKQITRRSALACGFIFLQPHTIHLIKNDEIKKGDVLSTANIAGVVGGKKCSDLIPLCHNIEIEQIKLEFMIESEGIKVTAFASCSGKTGIEMEALTAVSVSLLTIYDMCKAVDKMMMIQYIQLINKTKDSIKILDQKES